MDCFQFNLARVRLSLTIARAIACADPLFEVDASFVRGQISAPSHLGFSGAWLMEPHTLCTRGGAAAGFLVAVACAAALAYAHVAPHATLVVVPPDGRLVAQTACREQCDDQQRRRINVSLLQPPRPVIRWMIPSDVSFPPGAAAAPPIPLRGCPPRPALCRFADVFGEVLVITVPRRRAQWLRLSQQLSKHGIAHTLVHAVDGVASRAFRAAFAQTTGRNALGDPWRPTETALLSTHVDVLDYLLRSPFDNVLVLEDDALLLNDDRFAVEFDRQMRLVRPDWTQLYLGATIGHWGANPWGSGPEGFYLENPDAFAAMDASGAHAPFPVRLAYGAFAIAWRRSVAAELLAAHAEMSLVLDNNGTHVVAQRYPGRSLVFWPFLVAPDIRASELTGMDPGRREYFAGCKWNWSSFNMSGADAEAAPDFESLLVLGPSDRR